MLELVESLADYGADYRNFVRELLLHLREVLLVKLAPPGSPLLAQILPEEAQELRALAEALSEEDLLRGLDLLTRAEGELRNVTDPRVALDLVLLKLVQMRRLVPFVEVVARVERFLGGVPGRGARPPPRRARCRSRAGRLPRPSPRAAPAGGGAARRRRRPSAEAAAEPPSTPAAAPAGSAEGVLAAMLGQCQTRPSLAAPLRAATRPTGRRHAGAPASSGFPDVRARAHRGLPRLRPQARPAMRSRCGSRPGRRALPAAADAALAGDRQAASSCARKRKRSRPCRRRSTSSTGAWSTCRETLPGREDA